MKKKFNTRVDRFQNYLILIAVSILIFLIGCQPDSKKGVAPIEDLKSARKVQILSDDWRFQLDIRDIGENNGWYKDDFDRKAWANVTVPQAWDCYETALRGYEGVGWYTKTLNPTDFNQGNRVEIIFNRVMYYSKVWINGDFVGENIGGYLPFSFDVTKYLKDGQKNELVVRVDNRPRIDWLPAAQQIEWIQYGVFCKKFYW
jgi:beta-galactosidase/beta-glucuronidase